MYGLLRVNHQVFYLKEDDMEHTDMKMKEDGSQVTHFADGPYNAIRIASLWNAADGMTTEEAVRYLEHGPEMRSVSEGIEQMMHSCAEYSCSHKLCQLIRDNKNLLAKLEGK
jgi:hypothetical protein